MAVGAAWEIGDFAWFVAIDKQAIDALERFERRDVREPWRAVDIADRVNVREVGFVAVADFDVTAIGEFRLGAAWEDGLDADGDEADLCGKRAGFLWTFDADFHAITEIFGGGDFGVGEATDTLFGERFFEGFADFRVFHRKDVWKHFDDRDLGAEGVVDVGELHPDRAGADDDHFLGLFGENHGFFGADHGFTVERKRWQRAGNATGCDDGVLGFEDLGGAIGGSNTDFALAFNRAVAADVVDFVFLEKELDAASEFIGNFA